MAEADVNSQQTRKTKMKDGPEAADGVLHGVHIEEYVDCMWKPNNIPVVKATARSPFLSVGVPANLITK